MRKEVVFFPRKTERMLHTSNNYENSVDLTSAQVSSPSFKQIEAAASKSTSAGLIESSFIIACLSVFLNSIHQHKNAQGDVATLKLLLDVENEHRQLCQ